jgi:putative drug exporter of the RND superfamily
VSSPLSASVPPEVRTLTLLERIAGVTWRRPRLVLAIVAALAIGAVAVGHDVEHHLQAAGFTDPASESERATEVVRQALGSDPNPGVVVLVRAKDGGQLDTKSPAVRAEVARLTRELQGTRYIGRVVNPLAQPREGQGLIAADGRSLILSAGLSVVDIEQKGGIAAHEARKRVHSTQLDVAMTGYAPGFKDVNDQTRKDLTKAELIAFPALTLLLLLVFRGVIAAAVPLLLGVLSIVGTLFVLRLMSAFVDTSLFALNIATALSLGLAVDYGLLMVSRYREEIAVGRTPEEAHRITVLTAGRTALFSGVTVAGAMATLILMPQRFLYSVGAAGAAVGILSAVCALFVVPALLSVLGPRINALSIRRSAKSVSDESDGWMRLARAVMRRPILVALTTMGLLLALAGPLAGTMLTGPSGQAVSSGLPSYEATQYVPNHYPRDIYEAVTVTVHGAATPAALAAVRREALAVPGVVRGSVIARPGKDVAYLNLALKDPALDRSAQDAVKAIRALRPPPGAEILVSGTTARFIDQKQSLLHNAPVVIVAISLIIFVLMFLLTGSVVIPLKTLLMNALTLAATLGTLVLAFQHGWLTGLLQYEGPAAIEVSSLVFLFAVTFALATDYAVLVIARIKEQHDLGLSNEEAVATGIARTGRIISAAAVMIAVVFAAFAVSPIFFMKEIAVGMTVAVLIDATIVRALLVPSLMRLLGERNWWAPKPLRILHRRYGISEGAGPAPAESGSSA